MTESIRVHKAEARQLQNATPSTTPTASTGRGYVESADLADAGYQMDNSIISLLDNGVLTNSSAAPCASWMRTATSLTSEVGNFTTTDR